MRLAYEVKGRGLYSVCVPPDFQASDGLAWLLNPAAQKRLGSEPLRSFRPSILDPLDGSAQSVRLEFWETGFPVLRIMSAPDALRSVLAYAETRLADHLALWVRRLEQPLPDLDLELGYPEIPHLQGFAGYRAAWSRAQERLAASWEAARETSLRVLPSLAEECTRTGKPVRVPESAFGAVWFARGLQWPHGSYWKYGASCSETQYWGCGVADCLLRSSSGRRWSLGMREAEGYWNLDLVPHPGAWPTTDKEREGAPSRMLSEARAF